MFDHVIARASANPVIRQHCAFGPVTVLLVAGTRSWLLAIDGAGCRLSAAEAETPADFTLAAAPEAWAELQRPDARPGFQTLSAMRRARHLTVTGDTTRYMQHLMLLELLFAELGDGAASGAVIAEPTIEPISGRYLRLMIEGRAHRVYFEEAGPADGIPLLCLHTAGSDGRQYRHQLNDPAITDRFRLIAFDLPWHGKSSPPVGFESEVYQLTTQRYMAIVLAIADALGLERPVVMGCSIGGRQVLHLALHHADRFRAAIGLQSALFTSDQSGGDPLPASPLHRPDVHGPKYAGALMAGLTAPKSPTAERWETMWHYMQGGPGIFAGDLHYYFEDGDLRDGRAAPLADGPCPIYLLSGEYDISATPEMGREVAEVAKARHFEVMRDMGHFPMSENPAAFRRHLLPILDMIARES